MKNLDEDFMQGVEMACACMKGVSDTLHKRALTHGPDSSNTTDTGLILFGLSCIVDMQEILLNSVAALVADKLNK